jgi:hypothetical protein
MQRTYLAESLSNSNETNRIVSRPQGRFDQQKWRKGRGHFFKGLCSEHDPMFHGESIWNANPRISQDSKNESVQFPSPSMIPSAPFQLEAVRPVKWWPFTPSPLQSFNHYRVMCLCNRDDTWSRHQSRYNCIPLDMWIKHWVFTHLVGKHGQLSTCVIPPWSLNVTDTDAYPYIYICIYIYLKKTCHLLISWTVMWTCARYQLPCEIELGKTLCSFNPFIQHTVLSFLAICTASISKGIKTALHSGSLLRRSSLSLLRRFNIQGWSNWTESFSQTGSMKPQTTPSELPPFNKGGLMAKSSWLVGVPKTV